MRQEHELDKILKDALTLECTDLTASRDLKQRIDEEILLSQKEANMKHLSIKKLVIGVAVGCLLVSGGVFAAERAVSFSTHVYLDDMVKEYDRLGEIEQELGYQVDAVESFANGYRFQGMLVNEWEGMDDEGNKVSTSKSLCINYEKRGEKGISLLIEKPVETSGRDKVPDVPNMTTRVCGDVTCWHETITNKQVPTDYVLTDEDKAAEANGEYYISEGTPEVEIHQNSYVHWIKDGVWYQLLGFDLNLSADEMLDMAEEILNAN